jgi:hypothetical protein
MPAFAAIFKLYIHVIYDCTKHTKSSITNSTNMLHIPKKQE